jgi:hypothetical protein
MSKNTVLAALALLVALSVPATADAQMRFGLGAGPSFPLDHLAEQAGTGFHLQGSVGLDLPLLPIGARADVLWQQFPDNHDGSFTNLGGLLNATVALPLPLARPYLIGGVGLMQHEAPEEDHGDHTHEGEGGTEFAFGVGAGLQLRLFGLGGFVEARYLDWGHGNSAVPVTIGLSF